MDRRTSSSLLPYLTHPPIPTYLPTCTHSHLEKFDLVLLTERLHQPVVSLLGTVLGQHTQQRLSPTHAVWVWGMKHRRKAFQREWEIYIPCLSVERRKGEMGRGEGRRRRKEARRDSLLLTCQGPSQPL